jgi:hypothetical protein
VCREPELHETAESRSSTQRGAPEAGAQKQMAQLLRLGHVLDYSFGSQGRNRTANTRIFNLPAFRAKSAAWAGNLLQIRHGDGAGTGASAAGHVGL